MPGFTLPPGNYMDKHAVLCSVFYTYTKRLITVEEKNWGTLQSVLTLEKFNEPVFNRAKTKNKWICDTVCPFLDLYAAVVSDRGGVIPTNPPQPSPLATLTEGRLKTRFISLWNICWVGFKNNTSANKFVRDFSSFLIANYSKHRSSRRSLSFPRVSLKERF